MGLELPIASAVIARLRDPEVNLAAYGSVVLPLSMVIEAPIIMLLAASTALCRDWPAFLLVRRFMTWSALGLTAVHVAVAFTPLFDLVFTHGFGAPEPVREPARAGMRILSLWTACIAYRRFHQGVLIRGGRSHDIGIGTVLRLTGLCTVLALCALVFRTSGIAAATWGVAVGVFVEAVYVGMRVRPILHGPFRDSLPTGEPLRFPRFVTFYVPLALTSLLHLLTGPIGAAALSRMPRPLESLAVWPVVQGLLFTVRSAGIAYNEVVVALLDRPGARDALARFALALTLVTSGVVLSVAVTPLAGLYFGSLSGLTPSLATLAATGLLVCWPLAGLSVLQSWHQGKLVHAHRTRAVPEAVVAGLAALVIALIAGVAWGRTTGLYVGLVATVLGQTAQVLWLRWRGGLISSSGRALAAWRGR